jgi:hypothetical protein
LEGVAARELEVLVAVAVTQVEGILYIGLYRATYYSNTTLYIKD